MLVHTEQRHGASAQQDPTCDPGGPAPRLLRTAALVGRYAHRHLHDTMRTGEFDVVFIESTAHAYSKIKQVLPGLVIVCIETDDMDGCQILSMLALDSETSRIPVLTYLTPRSDCVSAEETDGAVNAVSSLGTSLSN
jgi:CheY-like chemotaxis protein